MNSVFFSRPTPRSDEEILRELNRGDSWTSDPEQLARLAALGIPVCRIDRHVGGHLVNTSLNGVAPEIVEQSNPMNWAGDPSLNRPPAWTEEPPTEDGFYWLRPINPRTDDETVMVEVWRCIAQTRNSRISGRRVTDFDGYEWSQQILPPP